MSRTAEKIVCRASWRDPNSCQFLGSGFFNSLLGKALRPQSAVGAPLVSPARKRWVRAI
jgi:hypothetical protein